MIELLSIVLVTEDISLFSIVELLQQNQVNIRYTIDNYTHWELSIPIFTHKHLDEIWGTS